MRSRIAHLAARMIAEDGVSDYGLAKRKAARQAGAPDSRNLPTNLEIEEALRAYQQLYQADEHPERLQHLRELALDMMRLLAEFSPHLTGALLSGTIGSRPDVHLQLFTDNLKELEIFLLNQQIPFRVRETRVWVGDIPALVPGPGRQHPRDRHPPHRALAGAPAPAVAPVRGRPAARARGAGLGGNAGGRRLSRLPPRAGVLLGRPISRAQAGFALPVLGPRARDAPLHRKLLHRGPTTWPTRRVQTTAGSASTRA